MADEERIRELIDQLRTEEWRAAQAELIQIGKPAVSTLNDALTDKDRAMRWKIAWALAKIGEAAVPALLNVLRDNDTDTQAWAAWALGEIGDARAVIPLIETLKDEDWRLRWRAAEALGMIGDARAVEPLIEALKDENPLVRVEAAEALGMIGDARAVEPLIEALKDENEDVRVEVAWALGKIPDNSNTTEEVQDFERKLDEGLARLQKRYRDDDLVEVGFQIARLKQKIAARKNELASSRDLILEDIPKPPPKKKGRMYQTMRRATHGR